MGTTNTGTYNIYCSQQIQYDNLDSPPNINSFDECMQACDVYVAGNYGSCIGVTWLYNVQYSNIQCNLKYATKDGGLAAEADASSAILVAEGTFP